MSKMLWGGRFEKPPKDAVFEYMSAENVKLDERLVAYDVLGSLAHVRMLSEQGILKKEEGEEIAKALHQVLAAHEKGQFALKRELEDVHMNVESEVSRITPMGKKMHTARSRNDQIALDMRLFLRDEMLAVASSIVALQKSFSKLSKKDAPMPAYTHTRVAQPVTVSFWCESYVQGLNRDLERIFDAYKRVNMNPLGACAVSGTRWNIDRKRTAELLGFQGVLENEMDAIGARGEPEAEIAFAISQLMARLSRFAEEGVWFSETGMVKIGDEYTTGSSIMPNKKNADILELLRGRTARAYAALMHILVAEKGLISGYNSDIQESKFAIMQALDSAKGSLAILIELVPTLQFNEAKMAQEIREGYANATELADFMAMNGMAFREAHEKVGKMVGILAKEGKFIEDLADGDINRMLGAKLSSAQIKEAKGLWKERLRRNVSVDGLWEKKIAGEQARIDSAFRKL